MPIKTYFFSAFFCVMAATNAPAQTVVDSSYQTTYYNQKVTLFNLLPKTKNDIVFLGNSITDIGEWAEIWQNSHVKNRGISGDNTFGVLARLSQLVATKPAKIFIMIGINDIAKNVPDSTIITNYLRIINTIKITTPLTKIIVQSLLPTNNEFDAFKNHQNKVEHIKAVNAALQNSCKQMGIVFVNLYPQFLNNLGKLSKDYTNDGLHITGPGYMLWKKTLQQNGLMQ